MGAVNRSVEQVMTRLSSGLRINSAADDAPGLAISEKTRANIRGLNQANKNILDGISLVQTADGALHEVQMLLQRGRELAVQAANGTLTDDDKEFLDDEMQQLMAEIDRIAEATEFNGRKILGGADPRIAQLVDGLRQTWLAEAESLVASSYGLSASGMPIKIVAERSGSNPAWATWVSNGSQVTSVELHVNMSDFSNFAMPNGGSPPQYLDRVIAHEMVHLAMDSTIGVSNYAAFAALPDWFKEGTAEFVHGADERLNGDLAAAGGAANLVAELNSWSGSSADYAAAYGAVKYLHERIQALGDAAGIRTVIQNLTAGGTTFDQAINAATGGAYATAAAFLTDYQSAGGGQTFLNNLAGGGQLTDADTGSYLADTTGVPKDAINIMPDATQTDTWDPLSGYDETWPTKVENSDTPGPLQVGALEGQTLDLPEISISSFGLGVGNLDLVKKAGEAMTAFDTAINQVSTIRSQLGALQNRLEHAASVNALAAENQVGAESKIRDADMALEMATLTRQQILLRSSSAMLAQANSLRRGQVQTLLA